MAKYKHILNGKKQPKTHGVFRVKYNYKFTENNPWYDNMGEMVRYVDNFDDLHELVDEMISNAGYSFGAGVDGISIDFIPDYDMDTTYSMPEGDPVPCVYMPEGDPIKSDIMPDE